MDSKEQTTSAAAATEEIPFRDPNQAELELRMCKDIDAMPEEVRDRFKGLKVLYDQVNAIDEEEEKEYRQLELKYEKLYQEVYAKRAALLAGQVEPDQDLIAQFEKVKTALTDEDYEKLEVEVCDVKDIQNMPRGVSGFWLKAMLGNENLNGAIMEKDRAILQYLEDVKLDLHETGMGYTLTFTFEKNSYFAGTTMTKTFVMSKPNVIEKCVGTAIEWNGSNDPTKEKKKKKVKQPGGGKKTVTKTVKCESFFNFFETIEAKDENKKGDGEDSAEEDIGEMMDQDFEMGNEFKDDLIPLALEYYLGVIEKADPEDGSDDDDDDSDEDEKPKKKKGKGPKMPANMPPGAKGPNGEECK